MDENYLWDRSGEADAEVQDLEELLGTLRYQPRALQIPAEVTLTKTRSLVTAFAVAASVVIFVGMGSWLSLNRYRSAGTAQTTNRQPAIEQLPSATIKPNETQVATVTNITPNPAQKRSLRTRNVLASRNNSRAAEPRLATLTPDELAEKEQILLALRLVSAKLNFAQRKTQGAAPLNAIRNQHRIG